VDKYLLKLSETAQDADEGADLRSDEAEDFKERPRGADCCAQEHASGEYRLNPKLIKMPISHMNGLTVLKRHPRIWTKMDPDIQIKTLVSPNTF
jgi:hypothetical protein